MLRWRWADKRSKAKSKPQTKQSPAWLTLNADTWIVDKAKAKTVKHIFTLSTKGLGAIQIMQQLTKDDIEPITGKWKRSKDKKTSKWHPTREWKREYITRLLRDRSVLASGSNT